MTASARRLRSLVRRRVRKILSPRPVETVSGWAATYRHLSRESSAEPGRWEASRNPVMNEIQDAAGDPTVPIVVVKAASQVGKTEAILNLLAWIVDKQPGPVLMVLPTHELARAFSLERLAPMLRDTPILRGRVADPKSRSSEATILSRRFAGGSITLVGANSAAALSSRPCRFILCDEADRYPIVLAGEGSPIQLAYKRSQAFPNRKLVLTSSPTLQQTSVIEQWYQRGDQRTLEVSCPDCAAPGPLSFDRLHWEKDPEGNALPDTTSWSCVACGALVPESGKRELIAGARWVPAYPDRPIRSYHLSALASPFLRWAEVVSEFLESKADPARLQVWTNTVAGDVWREEPRSQALEHRLADRLERFTAEVPAGAGVLTAGVDVQDAGLAVSVWGWGAGSESWLVHHDELLGSPGEAAVWANLDQLLLRTWTHATGALLRIRAVAIDTGGHFTPAVYQYAAPRQGRTVAPIRALKGHSSPTYSHILGKPATANRQGVRLYSYGSALAKDAFYARLAIETPGPGYVHLPDTVDKEFLNQLLAERVVYRKREGRNVRLYTKWRSRSEALDCALYGHLALISLGRQTVERLGELVPTGEAEAASEADAPAPVHPAPVLRFPWQKTRPTVPGWQAGGGPRNAWLSNW